MNVILQVAIGVVLVFAVTAVIVSSVMELISGMLRMRATNLERGIARMLDGEATSKTRGPVTAAVLGHPLITALAKKDNKLPSYIDAVTFTSAFLDAVGFDDRLVRKLLPAGAQVVDWTDKNIVAHLGTAKELEDRIEALPADDPDQAVLRSAWTKAKQDPTTLVRNLRSTALMTTISNGVKQVNDSVADADRALSKISPRLGTTVDVLWSKAEHDVGRFRHEIEDWFDREMQRVSGWYTRRAQWIMLAVGLAVAASFNISATTLTMALWHDAGLRDRTEQFARQVVVVPAEGSTATTTPQTTTPTTVAPGTATTTTVATARPPSFDDLTNIGLPVGWNSTAWPGIQGALVLHLLGIILVGVAASFGAPFWFDLLNRLVNLRVAGKPPQTGAQQRAGVATN